MRQPCDTCDLHDHPRMGATAQDAATDLHRAFHEAVREMTARVAPVLAQLNRNLARPVQP